MKKLLQKSIVAVLVLGSLVLLKFYFENPYLSIAMIVAFGLLCGLISRIFVGYVIPNQMLFRSRFIIYGIGFGLMIGLLIYYTKSVKEQTFTFQNLISWMLIAIPIGIIFQSSAIYSRFRKLKKRTINKSGKHFLISDFAVVTDSEHHSAKGLLAFSGNKLLFYEHYKYECLLELTLSEINPEIIKSKFLKIPNGISVKDKSYTIKVAFPLYWKKLIDNEINQHL